MGVGMDSDMLLAFGGEAKALKDSKVGGYLVKFSTASDPDLTGDFFSEATDFDLKRSTSTSVYYDHGLDGTLKTRSLGIGTMVKDGVGIWVEAQLDMRDEYDRAIMQLVKQGKLGWSSGTAAHLVDRRTVGKSNEIVRWPLGLDASLTPTPAEPRLVAVPLKSYKIQSDVLERAIAEPLSTVSPVDYFKAAKQELESRLSLDDHALRVETAAGQLVECNTLVSEMVEDLTDRFETRASVRAKASRQLSRTNRERIAASMTALLGLMQQMETLHASMETILVVNDQVEPSADEPEVEVLSEGERLTMEADLLRSEARAQGII
jgi:hypothetical protein